MSGVKRAWPWQANAVLSSSAPEPKQVCDGMHASICRVSEDQHRLQQPPDEVQLQQECAQQRQLQGRVCCCQAAQQDKRGHAEGGANKVEVGEPALGDRQVLCRSHTSDECTGMRCTKVCGRHASYTTVKGPSCACGLLSHVFPLHDDNNTAALQGSIHSIGELLVQ